MAPIRGAEKMSPNEIQFELQRGGKLVVFYYCVSIVVLTFRRTSPVYLVRAGENSVAKAMPWIILTALAGWWGIPWGPIYSIQSLVRISAEVRKSALRPCPQFKQQKRKNRSQTSHIMVSQQLT